MSITSLKEIFDLEKHPEHKYPNWILKHKVFKEVPHARKVFPELGLPNFQVEYTPDPKDTVAVDSAKMFIRDLYWAIANRKTQMINWLALHTKVGKERAAKIKNLEIFMNAMETALNPYSNMDRLISCSDTGIVKLVAFDDSIPGFKAGAGILKIITKLNADLTAAKMLKISDYTKLATFKTFSSNNIPIKAMNIVFASDGADGIWDIATMSMRGIKSCQSWSGGRNNSVRLIGSMVDPFTGIIYMTPQQGGTSEYGSKMIRRCIVRFICKEDGSPALLLEKMYPAFHEPSAKVFVKVLQEKVGKQIPVLWPYSPRNSYVPIADELANINSAFYPYRDSGIAYSQGNQSNPYVFNEQTRKANINSFARTEIKRLLKSPMFSSANTSKWSKDSQKIVKLLKAKKPVKLSEKVCQCKRAKCAKPHSQSLLDAMKRCNSISTITESFTSSIPNDKLKKITSNVYRTAFKDYLIKEFNDIADSNLKEAIRIN